MNDLPPRDDPPDEIDDRYRRASALDTSRPSETVRSAVRAHAARLARSRRAWRRLPMVGTLAAAALAGLLITPHFLEPQFRPVPVPHVPAPASTPAPAPPPTAAPSPTAAPTPSANAIMLREPSPPPRARSPLQSQSLTRALTPAQAMPQAPVADAGQALRQAAENGDTARLLALLEQRVSVDARDAGGRSALLLAVQSGRRDAVELLLAHGADPNAADDQGMTPLRAAVDANHPRIATALRRAGAR